MIQSVLTQWPQKKISNIEGWQILSIMNGTLLRRLLQGASKKTSYLEKKELLRNTTQLSILCQSHLLTLFYTRLQVLGKDGALFFLLGLCHPLLRLEVKSLSSRPKSKNSEQSIPQGRPENSCPQNTRYSKTNSWVSLEQGLSGIRDPHMERRVVMNINLFLTFHVWTPKSF